MMNEVEGKNMQPISDTAQPNPVQRALEIPQRVQVAVRIRPPGPGANGNTAPIVVDGNCIRVEVAPMHSFIYDAIFDSEATQDDLYTKLISPLVDVFLAGYNATIFAYGQTGSGKTFTMGTGLESCLLELLEDPVSTSEHGVVPRAISEIFAKMSTFPKGSVTMYASFIEIYNEQAKDLLTQSCTNSLVIREDMNGDIFLAGCHEEQVFHPSDLYSGTMARSTGHTDMNASSSRSHAILTLTFRFIEENLPNEALNSTIDQTELGIHRQDPSVTLIKNESSMIKKENFQQQKPESAQRKKGDSGQRPSSSMGKVSRFHFVDLAGSERLKRTNARGARAREAIAINGGLLALGNVISALSSGGKEHVPYRDSKLTRLLQNALGGNSCTLMIACISPDEASLHESINTLKYAARAKNIRNQARINDDHTHSAFEVAQLRKQIMNLKKENLELRAVARMPPPPTGNNVHRMDTITPQLALTSMMEGNVSALRATYEAKINYLQETISRLKRNEGGDRAMTCTTSLSKVFYFPYLQTLREKYEERIQLLSRELNVAKAKEHKPTLIAPNTPHQDLQAMAHQINILRGTLNSARSDRTRVISQMNEEMTRLRAAFESREAELRQLRINERESRDEISRLRRGLEYQKSFNRKKSISYPGAVPNTTITTTTTRVTPSRFRSGYVSRTDLGLNVKAQSGLPITTNTTQTPRLMGGLTPTLEAAVTPQAEDQDPSSFAHFQMNNLTQNQLSHSRTHMVLDDSSSGESGGRKSNSKHRISNQAQWQNHSKEKISDGLVTLPLLSPETLHRRSAFIISRTDVTHDTSPFSLRFGGEFPANTLLTHQTPGFTQAPEHLVMQGIEKESLNISGTGEENDQVMTTIMDGIKEADKDLLTNNHYSTTEFLSERLDSNSSPLAKKPFVDKLSIQPLSLRPIIHPTQSSSPLSVMSLFHRISEFTAKNSS